MEIAPEVEQEPIHVAVVTAADGVRLVALATSMEELLVKVAEYVEPRVVAELPLGSAMEVMDHLIAGRNEAAVKRYFDCASRRWDVESLHMTTVPKPETAVIG
jgi:hypothetical protein